MIDEITPIQFIEGINEGEQMGSGDYLNVGEWPFIAIKYTANLTYSLSEFEIGTLVMSNQKPNKYEVKIYPDYKCSPNPYDLVLAAGLLEYSPDKVNGVTKKWSRAVLDHNVVLISGKTYWLVLTSRGDGLYLLRGQNGNKISMLVKKTLKWRKDDMFNEWEFMLRFYGRILP